jgi:type IV secretory pathway component VirB8
MLYIKIGKIIYIIFKLLFHCQCLFKLSIMSMLPLKQLK